MPDPASTRLTSRPEGDRVSFVPFWPVNIAAGEGKSVQDQWTETRSPCGCLDWLQPLIEILFIKKNLGFTVTAGSPSMGFRHADLIGTGAFGLAWFTFPWIAAVLSGVGGFGSTVAVQSGLWLRRMLPFLAKSEA